MELRFNIKCDKSNIRLDQYLVSLFPDISRSKIQTIIKSTNLLVNGMIAKPSMILSGDEQIVCDYRSQIKTEIIPQNIALDIIHEDEDIIVINKQPNLVVHPGSGNWENTLVNGLMYHFNSLSNQNSDRPGIVHRLDKDTSGVIIVAKNDIAHHYLSQQFQKRVTKKEYKALVWGIVNNPGKIEGKIGRHSRNRQLFASVSSGGRIAITRYEPQEILPPLTFMSLFPETGRTHQLRVHMKEIGHPIIQDPLYGGEIGRIRSYHEKYTRKVKSVFMAISRTALHAYSLRISHPSTHETMQFMAEYPTDLRNALNVLKDEE